MGDFKNGGEEWFPKGVPEEVRVYDFLDQVTGEGDTLRRVRSLAKPGVGERGNRPRHGPVCRQQYPPVVEARWGNSVFRMRRPSC